MAKEYIELLCPVCARTLGKIILNKKATDGKGNIIKEQEKYLDQQLGFHNQPRMNYLDYLAEKWNMDKNEWGFVRDASGGKGHGFPIVERYTDPEDNPELFEKLKQQLLRGLEWWVSKGWINKEDIMKILR